MIFCATILILVITSIVGIFLATAPASAIELQRKFYEKINWVIIPVSMEKELRNTKRMGLWILIATLITALYCCVKVWR
jgi:hypothetical protein